MVPEQRALEAVRLALEGRDQALVGGTARKGAEQDEAIALDHDPLLLEPLPGEVVAELARALLRDGLLAKAGEL